MNRSLQVLAQGFIDAGVGYFANFPGFHSHELFDLLGKRPTSIDEKVAYEMAYGASLAGVRTVFTCKNVGLNVAADPFLNSLIAGVNGGLAVVVIDDVEMEGSQLRQDSRYYREFFGGLWFEPSTIQEAYDMAYFSFSWAEQFDLPIVIRLTNQFLRLEGDYTPKNSQQVQKPIPSNPAKYVVHPIFAQAQRERWKKKRKQFALLSKLIMRSRGKSTKKRRVSSPLAVAKKS